MPELSKSLLRYLLYLSPRTPRPKSSGTVTFRTRKKVFDLGLAELAKPDDRLARHKPPGNAFLKITEAGERAIDAALR